MVSSTPSPSPPPGYHLLGTQGIAPSLSMEVLLNVISVTLAASVLGDHCSPISDTTILSSLASDCNHIDHVRTQLPYALTVGGVSLPPPGCLPTWGEDGAFAASCCSAAWLYCS
ncbi:MAG: hypothetical protein H6559_34665 [Lewinellaceae bacterium]|nr:hypothetical protein [Lewinellaceae bacterium]